MNKKQIGRDLTRLYNIISNSLPIHSLSSGVEQKVQLTRPRYLWILYLDIRYELPKTEKILRNFKGLKNEEKTPNSQRHLPTVPCD